MLVVRREAMIVVRELFGATIGAVSLIKNKNKKEIRT